MKKLFNLLEEGNIASFGCSKKALPRILLAKKNGRTRIFLHHKMHQNKSDKKEDGILHYEQLSEIREEKSDIYFLDHEALKVLFVDFPATAHYVLVRPVFRFEWFIALPGLIRRILIGLVRVRGFITLETEASTKRWLVIEHLLTDTLHTRLSLSEEVGVQGLLNHLKKTNARYVVLRFFEKLPALFREGGDLDLLVADEDEQVVKNFLQKNPGPIGVDVWTVSRTTFNDITYYPPPIARKIIASAISGPAGANVPAQETAFLALAYHVVYHKGPFAGVPTSLKNIIVNEFPENDYAGSLKALAKKIGVDVPITMEALDEYLNEKGWRPKLDTLAKIAVKNRWVWERFFSVQPTKEIGLGVIILKRRAFTSGSAESMMKEIEKDGRFVIIHTKKFKDEEIHDITNNLRGGVWHVSGENLDEYLPHTAVVVLDVRQARRSYVGAEKSVHDEDIRTLKKRLRKMFDKNKGSMIHATDNSHESWEYVDVCFSEEVITVKKEIESLYTTFSPSLLERIRLYGIFAPRFLAYRISKMKHGMKNSLIRLIMRV